MSSTGYTVLYKQNCTGLFSARSTRHAAVSAARHIGVNLEEVLKAAAGRIFLKYYNRDISTFADNKELANFFSNT